MKSADQQQGRAADQSRAPRLGVKLMLVILVGLIIVAIYANVQKVRRDKIEKVTIIPASAATPTARTTAP